MYVSLTKHNTFNKILLFKTKDIIPRSQKSTTGLRTNWGGTKVYKNLSTSETEILTTNFAETRQVEINGKSGDLFI